MPLGGRLDPFFCWAEQVTRKQASPDSRTEFLGWAVHFAMSDLEKASHARLFNRGHESSASSWCLVPEDRCLLGRLLLSCDPLYFWFWAPCGRLSNISMPVGWSWESSMNGSQGSGGQGSCSRRMEWDPKKSPPFTTESLKRAGCLHSAGASKSEADTSSTSCDS